MTTNFFILQSATEDRKDRKDRKVRKDGLKDRHNRKTSMAKGQQTNTKGRQDRKVGHLCRTGKVMKIYRKDTLADMQDIEVV
jgi:hypothetical protein